MQNRRMANFVKNASAKIMDTIENKLAARVLGKASKVAWKNAIAQMINRIFFALIVDCVVWVFLKKTA